MASAPSISVSVTAAPPARPKRWPWIGASLLAAGAAGIALSQRAPDPIAAPPPPPEVVVAPAPTATPVAPVVTPAPVINDDPMPPKKRTIRRPKPSPSPGVPMWGW